MDNAINVDAPKRAQLQQVADLMLEIYQTLVRMRYLDPEWIAQGPHDISSLIPLYRSYGLDDSIIYLYSILPYVYTGAVIDPYSRSPKNVRFYEGSEFADFREGSVVKQGRDPLRYKNPTEILKPWMTPLSASGRNGPVLVYSAKNDAVWIREHNKSADTGPLDDEDTEDAGRGSESVGEVERIMGEEYAYQPHHGRSPAHVLRGIMRRYHDLCSAPGGTRDCATEWKDTNVLKSLYSKHGWPSAFVGDSFLVDIAGTAAASLAKGVAEEPLRQLNLLRGGMERSQDPSTWERAEEALQAAETERDKWLERYLIWEKRMLGKTLEENLARQEEKCRVLCPDGVCQRPEDLPLWKQEQLRVSLQLLQDQLRPAKDETSESQLQDRNKRLRLKYTTLQISIYQRAYDAAKEEANRLCPGRKFAAATGRRFLHPRGDPQIKMRDSLLGQETAARNLTETSEWVAALPEGPDSEWARKAAENSMDLYKVNVEGFGKTYSLWAKVANGQYDGPNPEHFAYLNADGEQAA